MSVIDRKEPAPASPSAPAGQSASARIVREVIRGLYEGRYAPGQRLAEPELIEQFGASRATVRESIRRMEAEGLVDVLPYRGAVIRKLSAQEAIDALLVMEYCVGLAARLAAERIDHGDNRASFQAVATQLLGFSEAALTFEFVKTRNRFYRRIGEMSANRELRRIIPSIQVHLIRRSYSLPLDTRFEDYRRMIDTILAGDGAAAETAARIHIANTAALVRREIEDRTNQTR